MTIPDISRLTDTGDTLYVDYGKTVSLMQDGAEVVLGNEAADRLLCSLLARKAAQNQTVA